MTSDSPRFSREGPSAWGWDGSWEAAAMFVLSQGAHEPGQDPGPAVFPVRVSAVHRTGALAVASDGGRGTEEGRVLAPPAADPALPADSPTVGDWLLVSEAGTAPDGLPLWREEALLPRRTFLARKAAGVAYRDARSVQPLAANVDIVLAMTACGSDFSPGRVERMLALARESGAFPVVLLTKTDTDPAYRESATMLEACARGVPVIPLSPVTGEGMEELRRWLTPRATVVMLGSSGIGKSTLLNAVAGSGVAATREVREGDGKGRHSTTHRELFLLPSGVLVADSPGIREVQLWADPEGLSALFPEIGSAAERCRFRDCTHESEPGCGVLAALSRGEIEPERYERWARMVKETGYLDRRGDVAAAAAERAKWKTINKSIRAMQKSGEIRGAS